MNSTKHIYITTCNIYIYVLSVWKVQCSICKDTFITYLSYVNLMKDYSKVYHISYYAHNNFHS